MLLPSSRFRLRNTIHSDIKTNVLRAQNIIDACLDMSVKNVVALSTDKAAAPVNLYGATKLCSDKLFLAAKNIMGGRNIRFSVVKYGNVMGSRGSVIPFFLKQRHTGKLPITDPAMTRFNISVHEGIELVLYALENSLGEIFCPNPLVSNRRCSGGHWPELRT